MPYANSTKQLYADFLICLVAILMISHQIPGFYHAVVWHSQKLTVDAYPYTLQFHSDELLAGWMLLPIILLRREAKPLTMKLFKTWLICTMTTLVLVIGLAVAVGYVGFAPKWPSHLWQWVLINLAVVCVAEEAVFRGLVQHGLARLFRKKREAPFIALTIASLMFGLAHFAGGPIYIGLATLAGFGYGGVYWLTGRIEASILTHFLLNLTHILLFTYPALSA